MVLVTSLLDGVKSFAMEQARWFQQQRKRGGIKILIYFGGRKHGWIVWWWEILLGSLSHRRMKYMVKEFLSCFVIISVHKLIPRRNKYLIETRSYCTTPPQTWKTPSMRLMQDLGDQYSYLLGGSLMNGLWIQITWQFGRVEWLHVRDVIWSQFFFEGSCFCYGQCY